MSAPCVLLWVLFSVIGPHVHAQPAALLGKDLEPKPVTFLGLTEQGVRVADRFGEVQTLTSDELLRITLLQPSVAAQTTDRATARLVDGQVLIGRFLGPGDDGESLRMALPTLGQQVDLPLDDLVSITMPGGETIAPNLEDDTVLLATGETLVGFIDAIDGDAVAFVVGDADDPIEIPFSRVRGLTIANKPKPVRPNRDDLLVRVGLQDGSVLLLDSAKTAGGPVPTGMSMTGRPVLPLPAVTLPIREVASIEPISASHRLQRLSDFEFEVIQGGKVFGVRRPPRLTSAGALQLHAPVLLGFDLPEGAARVVFSAALTLGDDISPSRRALAGCELVVYDGEQSIGRFELKPDDPAQRISLPLTSADLRIEVAPGVNGPVLDRVLLTDAEILLETTATR